jgi:hypothetical protein
MLTPNEIQAIHYQEFIKSSNLPDYGNKYHLALRILKKKPDAVAKLKERKAELKRKWGWDLHELQTIYYGRNDLNAFFNPRGDPTTTITIFELKTELENFKNYIEELVDDNIAGGLGLG